MASWYSLPNELTSRILRYVAESETKSHWMAEYAVVDRLWQLEIEKINFENLKIKQSDLQKFSTLLQGPRRLSLRTLSLQINLPKYSKKVSKQPETEDQVAAHNMIFTRSIYELFKILESWSTDDYWTRRRGKGLELELSAASDSDKWASSGRFLGEVFDQRLPAELDFELGALLEPLGLYGIPPVEIITRFSITRHNYRAFAAEALTPIIRSLPRLEEVNWEAWQQMDGLAQHEIQIVMAAQLPLWLSQSSLKRLSMFEHFGAFDVDLQDAHSDTYSFLADVIRISSVNLEALSVAYFVSAEEFFHPFGEGQTKSTRFSLPNWPRLKWLTLSSPMISKDYPEVTDEFDTTTSDLIHRLLVAAAAAAKRMPSLTTMEIFNADDRSGGVFRYFYVDGVAMITWTSTWEYELSPEVKQAWAEVAAKRTKKELIVCPEVKLDGYRGGPEGFFHSEIATRELLLHAASSANMMGERPYPAPVLSLER